MLTFRLVALVAMALMPGAAMSSAVGGNAMIAVSEELRVVESAERLVKKKRGPGIRCQQACNIVEGCRKRAPEYKEFCDDKEFSETLKTKCAECKLDNQ